MSEHSHSFSSLFSMSAAPVRTGKTGLRSHAETVQSLACPNLGSQDLPTRTLRKTKHTAHDAPVQYQTMSARRGATSHDQATETRAVCRGAKHTQLTNCHFHVYPACLAILYGAKGQLKDASGSCQIATINGHHCTIVTRLCSSVIHWIARARQGYRYKNI